jgi:iron complex transport system permease protein
LIVSNRNRTIFIFVLIIIAVVVSILSLGIGAADFNPFEAIYQYLGFGKESLGSTILLKIRLPRIILGFAVGGALAISGVLLQGLFRNDLVEPYTLGISGGASLGVAFSIALGLKQYFSGNLVTLSGFLGALGSALAVYFISSRRRGLSTQAMLLAGVMVSFISSSAVMFIMAISSSDDLQGIIFWIMGSLDTTEVGTSSYFLLFTLITLVISFYYCRLLNALQIGEEEAYYLGFNIERAKKVIFVIASLLTGIAVSLAGVIGFVGLVIPHLMRTISGSDNRFLIFSSYLTGGIFLVISDMVARSIIAPLELPVGVITGIVGGALFLSAIWRGRLKV